MGYFDEGEGSGVARFDPDRTALWKFNERTDPIIIDCYAMMLDGSTLWCCPYGDFPIVRVEHGAVKTWRNDVAGAEALARR